MKITNFMLADATNSTAEGKQNILGAGIRVVYAPDLPIVRPIHVFVTAEGGASEIGKHHVRVDVVSPSSRQTLIEREVDLEERPDVDERLPMVLNIRLDLGRYIFQEYGVHFVKIAVDRARATYAFALASGPPDAALTPDQDSSETVEKSLPTQRRKRA